MACDREYNPAAFHSVHPPTDVATLRGRVAIVRTLLDEFERTLARGNSGEGDGLVSAADHLRDELAQLSHQMRDVTEGLPRSQRAVVAPVAEASGPRCIDVRRTA